MRSVLTILLLVAAIAAEAPYHLPRPGPNTPAFNYNPPAPPAPPAPPLPVRPLPIPAPAPQSIQVFQPSFGYQYQQPSFGPTFIQPQPASQQRPQPIQAYFSSAPQPSVQYPPQPQPQYSPHPLASSYPQYIPQPPQPHPHPQPQPTAIPQPQPVPIPQPQPNPQPRPNYGPPQPIALPEPIRPLPEFISQQPQPAPQLAPHPQPIPQLQPQPLPQPQPAPTFNPMQYQQQQQFSYQQGYNYQQPQPLAHTRPEPQFAVQLPLQSQQLTYSSPALSSYQADSNQYINTQNQDQTHREALDSLVVDRVQKVITNEEHSSARNAGYQSLVSGVSLGDARPSLEILSFVHTSPQVTGFSQSSGSARTSSVTSTALASSPSSGYGFPTTASGSESNQSTQQGQSNIEHSFLPDTKPASLYGPPK